VRTVPVHAFGIAAALPPREVAALFGWTPDGPNDARYRVTKTLAMARHEGDRYIVIHDFGAVVFFDCSSEEREAFMAKLLASLPPEPHPPLLEDYLVEVEDGAEPSVSFDRALIPSLDSVVVELMSLVLAQSVVMDYYEEDVRAAYGRVDGFANDLAERGGIRLSERSVNRFVGNVLSVRNQIAMTLSLLDAPLITWEREVYDRLYRGLRNAFEIEDRYRTIEHKIQLIQQNLEIVVNLVQYRRGKILEMTIIALIAFEIVFLLLEKFVFRG
jgi:required for meiotic nuclear division protein 1